MIVSVSVSDSLSVDESKTVGHVDNVTVNMVNI